MQKGLRTRPYLLIVSVILIMALNVGVVYSASTNRVESWEDDIEGTNINTDIWADIDGVDGGMIVRGGYLGLAGSPEYKRIETHKKFSVNGRKVTASARLAIDGDYCRFGFVPDPADPTVPTSGYYFDTYQRGQDNAPGEEDHIFAIAWHLDAQGERTYLLEKKMPMSWRKAHILSISRTSTSVKYFIDGVLMRSLSVNDNNPLPIAIHNDRTGSMIVDKVSVSISS